MEYKHICYHGCPAMVNPDISIIRIYRFFKRLGHLSLKPWKVKQSAYVHMDRQEVGKLSLCT